MEISYSTQNQYPMDLSIVADTRGCVHADKVRGKRVNTVIKKVVEFVRGQQKPFKVNLVRASANTFLTRLTQQYRSIYILRLGATAFQLGLVDSVGGVAGTVVAAPTGWLADRHGIRKMFLIAMPLMALGSLLLALAPDWTATIPGVFLILLATQLLSTACPMVCGSYLKNEERATGKQLCDSLSAVPGLVAPMIAATLISEFGGLKAEGIRYLYFFQSIGFLLVLVFVYRFYFDVRKKQAPLSSSRFVDDMGQVFHRGRAVKRWIVYIFLSSTTFYLSATYWSAFVTEIKLGDGECDYGVSGAASGACASAGSFGRYFWTEKGALSDYFLVLRIYFTSGVCAEYSDAFDFWGLAGVLFVVRGDAGGDHGGVGAGSVVRSMVWCVESVSGLGECYGAVDRRLRLEHDRSSVRLLLDDYH